MDAAQFVQLFLAGGVGGILSALALYIRARGQNRVEARAQQDTHLLHLIDALNGDERTFREAQIAMLQALSKDLADERAARKDLDARLTTTQSALTVVTLERDEARREHARDRVERDALRTELDQAHQKIRALELELAAIKAQQEAHG